jgi:chemotaxis signal transduction protein/ABC-type nitrate/sulfonate/bicarbonate transport system substrate-binding protein
MPVDKTMKVLVVEDSKITRKMEIKILAQLGFTHICEADDGDDAVAQLLAHDDIALIISDWNMPNKNGYELLVWVRSNAKYRHLPFIMATAQSEKKQTQKANEAGVSNFVSKPFSPDELFRIIEETFSKKTRGPLPGKRKYIPRKTPSGKLHLRAAHIQITDHLTLGVLKNQIASEKMRPRSFELETRCMPCWNPVQKALETGEVDAAFILAPIAMDLFSYDVPIRLILFAHKNGSISIKRTQKGNRASLKDWFKGKTFYLPHILSIHHMLSYMFLSGLGLNPGMAGSENVDVFFEIVPPVNMPEFLEKNPNAGGFSVAEPIGTKAIAGGSGELLFLSGELWEYHPCCVLVIREELIDQYPDAVQEFTNLLVESGQFIAKYPEKAAEIGIDFLDPQKKLGLNVAVLKNVLKEPQGIKTDDLYPSIEDLDRIQRYMAKQMGIGSLIDLEKFVDNRFARNAYAKLTHTRHRSVFHDIQSTVKKTFNRETDEDKAKTRLDREGKYLIFSLCNQDYGIGIESVVEIIHMVPFRSIPQAPPFVKGVINLRAQVIPVIDLRLKFNQDERPYDDRTCIVILELTGKEHKNKTGIIVDTVSEVMAIKAGEIEDAPSFGIDVNTNFILGMAKMDQTIKILLDTNRLLKEEGQQLFELVA